MIGTSDLMDKMKKFKNIKFRHAYLKEHIRVGIASQIRIMRNKKNLSQSQLAELVGTKQAVISRLEDPDSGSVNINTLLKIAEAFDVGLLIKFSSFGKFIDESQDISPKALAVSTFSEEIECLKKQEHTLLKFDTKNYEEKQSEIICNLVVAPAVNLCLVEKKTPFYKNDRTTQNNYAFTSKPSNDKFFLLDKQKNTVITFV